MNKIHYVYIITNLLNGKQYVGDRTCKCDLNKDLYMGSGVGIPGSCHNEETKKKIGNNCKFKK
jgi:hypothetical protein